MLNHEGLGSDKENQEISGTWSIISVSMGEYSLFSVSFGRIKILAKRKGPMRDGYVLRNSSSPSKLHKVLAGEGTINILSSLKGLLSENVQEGSPPITS